MMQKRDPKHDVQLLYTIPSKLTIHADYEHQYRSIGIRHVYCAPNSWSKRKVAVTYQR